MKSGLFISCILLAGLVIDAEAQISVGGGITSSTVIPYRCKRTVTAKARTSCTTTVLNRTAKGQTLNCVESTGVSRVTILPAEPNFLSLAIAECALELNKDVKDACGFVGTTGKVTINVRMSNPNITTAPFQTYGFRKSYFCAPIPNITSSELKLISGR